MADRDNFTTGIGAADPSLPVDEDHPVPLHSVERTKETEIGFPNLSLFQVSLSSSSTPLDVGLAIGVNASIPSTPPMESDVDCACA